MVRLNLFRTSSLSHTSRSQACPVFSRTRFPPTLNRTTVRTKTGRTTKSTCATPGSTSTFGRCFQKGLSRILLLVLSCSTSLQITMLTWEVASPCVPVNIDAAGTATKWHNSSTVSSCAQSHPRIRPNFKRFGIQIHSIYITAAQISYIASIHRKPGSALLRIHGRRIHVYVASLPAFLAA
jgi:hypothetical protein